VNALRTGTKRGRNTKKEPFVAKEEANSLKIQWGKINRVN
jgi:hypothetical protein